MPSLASDPFSRELLRRTLVRDLVGLEERTRRYADAARAEGKRRDARALEREADTCRALVNRLGGEPRS